MFEFMTFRQFNIPLGQFPYSFQAFIVLPRIYTLDCPFVLNTH